MFLTNVLFKKAKSKTKHILTSDSILSETKINIVTSPLGTLPQVDAMQRLQNLTIMVLMESVVSGHKFIAIRERLAEKLELLKFDPYIQHESLYKERKKIRSMKSS